MSNPIKLRIMEKMNYINAQLVRSNKSRNLVWLVTTEDFAPKYCRNARTALKYIFMVKRSTGAYVSKGTIEALKLEIALSKKDKPSTM